jgi:two-component system sensor histidine kinase YesM
MACQRDDGDMETVISSLALMFRYSLYARTMVLFSQELEHVHNYIKVLNVIHSGKYQLDIRVGKRALSRTVLSMILQPLAENAVFHGFAGRTDKNNRIVIRAFCARRDGVLVVSVFDNGEGLSVEELAALTAQIHGPENNEPDLEGRKALQNIYRRMTMSFGGNFSMNVKSKKGSFTKIEMHIPEKSEPPLSI